MTLAMVDCRSLIQFCRAFHPHMNNKNFMNSNSPTSFRSRTRRFTTDSLNPFSRQFCHRSPMAAIDLIILLLVLASVAFLILPYLKFFFFQLLPIIHGFVLDLILDEPLPKCGNPHCKGLRRAVEYDIQLETEKCVKYSPTSDAYGDNNGLTPLELGQDREELEAELKKMAPPNGRTVLIFRAPCGCPAGRLEVWGPKKIRRIKK
ncbi:UNVERIFIED_CONTAM: hypothetical protein Sradi_0385000 [Sesamum radiatum]|uniref:Ribosomal protein L34e superfamily protein n=1 Tax=Sesamum radiatum TaxID=300843 RepID=A0AAW2W7Q7_SESRA